ncbi:MAG: HAMP domain-containing histidine kinase [Lachnospiraceae bacterium]|nr:HAMP domain-containing histidine kinase [Lachnospiraceae bacterium]
MTRRKIVKPVVKISDRLKKYIYIFLQTLFGVLIGVCFFVYITNSRIVILNGDKTEEYTPAFHELSTKYYDSKLFMGNLTSQIERVADYVAIRKQMETAGAYNPAKVIDIVDYYGINHTDVPDVPHVSYTLGNLVNWGKARVQHNILYPTYEEYRGFFVNAPDPVDEEGVYTPGIIDSIENKFLTVEGKKLEEYIVNPADYEILVAALENAAYSLQADYLKYLSYESVFDANSTNIRYYIALTEEGKREFYTNAEGIGLTADDQKITAFFKEYGKYVYVIPNSPDVKKQSEYLSNTGIEFDFFNTLINETYDYAYPDEDVKIWMALDTSYPVKDLFKDNYEAFVKTGRLLPWIISMGAISIIGFIVLAVLIVFEEKKAHSYPGAADDLKDFDRLPIEVSALFFIILVIVLYLGEMLLMRNMFGHGGDFSEYIIPLSVMLAADLFVMLLFVYGFVRRIICGNLLKGSFFAMAFPVVSRFFKKIYRRFWKAYDSAGVAVRTWTAYVFFMILNIFMGSMILFGEHPTVYLVILLVFDIVVGVVLFNRAMERKNIVDGIRRINDGDYDYQIDDRRMHGDNKDFADAVNNIGKGIKTAVETNIKDEKMKADLITNVSHDLKTPLTSIINYVDLLKRENIEGEKARKYISILDEKSQRLKQLTFDLVEASKVSSGNITLDMNRIDFNELLNQAIGEFEERFEERGLTLIKNVQGQEFFINADPARLWRVIENLFNNICKYALQDTRVYLDLVILVAGGVKSVNMSVKNISGQQLNIPAEELTERFIRGDVSRSTEGTGLGLSIAKSLTLAQGGDFRIYLDGDLFKVTITFPFAN